MSQTERQPVKGPESKHVSGFDQAPSLSMVESNQAQPGDEAVKNLLQRMILDKRRLSLPVEAFGRDTPRLIDLYEDDLNQFIGRPDIIDLGQSIARGALELDLLETAYRQNLNQQEPQKRLISSKLEQLEQERHDWQIRIEAIGRSGSIKADDLGLLLDRLRVELYHLRQKHRLSWPGQVLVRLIGAKPVHPKLAALGLMQRDCEQVRAALEGKQKQLADKFVADRIEKRRFLDQRESKFWQQLHQWSMEDPERFVVHRVLYGQPAIDAFLKANAQDAAVRDRFLDLARTAGIITAAEHHKLRQAREGTHRLVAAQQIVEREVVKVASELGLPMPVMAGQVIIDTRDQLTDAVRSFRKDLSGNNVKKITNRINRALYALAHGLPYRDLTQLFARDMIDRLGGDYRLRAGTFRIIINRVRYEGRQVVEIISVLNRDDPDYY